MNRFASILTLTVTLFCGIIGCDSKPTNLTKKDLPNSQPSLTGTWRGTGAQPDMSPYPMVMSITQKGNEITGTINWPTLGNCTTRFTGTITGTKIQFVETELIQGTGVGIPCSYQGGLLGNTIAGTCVYAGINGTFSVTINGPVPVVDERSKSKNSILRVIKADLELTRQHQNLPPNATPSQVAWSVGQYCDRLERLDMSDCPADFRVAYKHHIRAWRDTQVALKQLPDCFLEGVFMGAMNSLLRGETDGGQRRLELGLNQALERVRITWENVETTGAKYGAAL